jgi:putative acetyltransferase
MELRAYRDQDCLATRRVLERAVRLTASADYTDEQIEAWAPAGVDESELEAWSAARRGAQTFVAVEDGEVLGFGDLVDGVLLDILYVDPGAARRGIGSALVERIVALARAGGGELIETDASLTARPLFERHGFAVVAEQAPVVRGIAMKNFRMRRAL